MNILTSRAWHEVVKKLKADRAELIEQIITRINQQDADILRGRIHQIDDILELYPEAIGRESEE